MMLQPTFYDPRRKPIEIFWENEKMLVTSIFSFSHNVLYHIKKKKKKKKKTFESHCECRLKIVLI